MATINTDRKIGELRSPFWGGGAGSQFNTKSPGPRPSSIPSDILIHAAIWPQQIWAENWGLCPFGEGELGPHLTPSRLDPGLPLYQVASQSMQPFGHNRYGPKIGGCAPLGRGAVSSSDTVWPRPGPICVPSFIFIHPTAWLQYTDVTDRTDRQDKQRSDSIGRTVLQTVAQKRFAPSYRTVVCLCVCL